MTEFHSLIDVYALQLNEALLQGRGGIFFLHADGRRARPKETRP